MTESKKISVSGDLGSGKSVTSKYIAGKLGYKYFSTGEIQRLMAEERGISVLEMNKVADINVEIDRKIDETLIGIRESHDSYVLDSRLAWFFVPQSLKVYLRTNIAVTVKRIMSDKKRKSETYASKENARFEILERKTRENARFLLAYGADCGNLANYDTIIETTSVMPDEIGNLIIKLSDASLSMQGPTFWVSPKFMFPTRPFDSNQAREAHAFSKGETDTSANVSCVFMEGYYFIIDGHKRVSAALQNKVPLLQVQLTDADARPGNSSTLRDFAMNVSRESSVDAWQHLHGFSYEIFPQLDAAIKTLP